MAAEAVIEDDIISGLAIPFRDRNTKASRIAVASRSVGGTSRRRNSVMIPY